MDKDTLDQAIAEATKITSELFKKGEEHQKSGRYIDAQNTHHRACGANDVVLALQALRRKK